MGVQFNNKKVRLRWPTRYVPLPSTHSLFFGQLSTPTGPGFKLLDSTVQLFGRPTTIVVAGLIWICRSELGQEDAETAGQENDQPENVRQKMVGKI